MNSEELYTSVILEHSKHPRFFGKCANETDFLEVHNPLCGDTVGLSVVVEEEVLQEVKAIVDGCAICKASTSVFLSDLQNQKVADILEKITKLENWLKSSNDESPNVTAFVAFNPIKKRPMRVKCMTLSWHALKKILSKF